MKDKEPDRVRWGRVSGKIVKEESAKLSSWSTPIKYINVSDAAEGDRLGIWTIKVWEKEQLFDHRKFLVGSAVE